MSRLVLFQSLAGAVKQRMGVSLSEFVVIVEFFSCPCRRFCEAIFLSNFFERFFFFGTSRHRVGVSCTAPRSLHRYVNSEK